MSDAAVKGKEYQWQHAPFSALDQPVPHSQTSENRLPGILQAQHHPSDDPGRPPLKSHRSFPYALGQSSRPLDRPAHDELNAPISREAKEYLISRGPLQDAGCDLQKPSFGGSAPASPVGRLTPPASGAGQDDADGEDEDTDFATEQAEDDPKRPMTAAELRAQKRKMKRFR